MTRERPILFSGEMVRAILEDRKTATRRIVKGADRFPSITRFERWIVDDEPQNRDSGVPLWMSREPDGTCREWGCLYGEIGTRLWVRETWGIGQHCKDGPDIWYKATEDRCPPLWKASIHMPRAFSRITLEITGVRVERLNEISGADALAEGVSRLACYGPGCPSGDDGCNARGCIGAREAYQRLWESIHGAGAWESNPWVFVIEFRRVEAT